MAQHLDTTGLLAIIIDLLRGNADVTTRLAQRTIGTTTSQAMSIMYGFPAGQTPAFPCISIRDLGPSAADPEMADAPNAYCEVQFEISIFGRADLIRPITGIIDDVLRYSWRGGVIDTALWKIQMIDIASGGAWQNQKVPREIMVDDTGYLEQRVKLFPVKASWLGALT